MLKQSINKQEFSNLPDKAEPFYEDIVEPESNYSRPESNYVHPISNESIYFDNIQTLHKSEYDRLRIKNQKPKICRITIIAVIVSFSILFTVLTVVLIALGASKLCFQF